MNRFFTLLFTASCLTVVGQSEYCLDGTVWDEALQGCVPSNPSDLDFDGLVDVSDFLGHLGAFGSGCDEGVTETNWHCGDPLEYQGYTYETVQIGDQCWFAENLRCENYLNGDAIQSNFSSTEWNLSEIGAFAIYGEGESECNDYSPTIEACDENFSELLYGLLYNWYAVVDDRALCPQGWMVPDADQWSELFGLIVEYQVVGGYYLTNQNLLKTESGWLNDGGGSNEFGFNGAPGGRRTAGATYQGMPPGSFQYAGYMGCWWTSSTWNDSSARYRRLNFTNQYTTYSYIDKNFGLSVRCIQDVE